jgi:hypothetical protein
LDRTRSESTAQDSRSVHSFLAELIRAANEIERLELQEKSRLLQHSASTIRELREAIAITEAPLNDAGAGDIVHDLLELSERVHELVADEVALALLDAAADIRTLQRLIEGQPEKERSEE